MFFRDSEEFRALIKAFKKADERVLSTVLKTNADSVEEYRNKTFNYVNQVNASLMKKTIAWAEKDIPVTYQQGRKQVSKNIALDTATMLGTFGLITLADEVIKGSKRPKTTRKRINIPPPSDNLSEKEQKKVNLHTETAYIELSRRVQHATDLQKEKINQAIKQIEKSGYGVTVERVKDLLKNTLEKENKSLFVTYSNGSKMPLEKYAEMCARTSRLETINTGVFNRVKELGYDLVLCSVVPNCCPYCKKYEGKVYSISGKDKRFPALYETALQKGYNVMHPNCRHEFTLFVESMVTATDLNKLIAKSNHFEEFDKNDKIFKIYNKNQALQRQWIDEFRRYKELKSLMGNDLKYTTLASFRRAYRSDENSFAYKCSHNTVRDFKQYLEWQNVIGKENLPDSLEKFQDLKYNKIEEFKWLEKDKEIFSEINKKEWSDVFKLRTKEVYLDFKKQKINLCVHALSRYISRNMDKDSFFEIDKRNFNYIQEDGKKIKYYNCWAVIYNKEGDEIVSFVKRNTVKRGWKEI